ncbi:MAG TPA: hypothetical protein VGV15_24265 [Terriglobales bacterium]|nr:hypothetical protein [Terriglobales bacterium]
MTQASAGVRIPSSVTSSNISSPSPAGWKCEICALAFYALIEVIALDNTEISEYAGIKTFYFDSQVIDREQAANPDPKPIRPVLPPLSENAHLGPVRTPTRPARAKIDFRIWCAVERENNFHVREFVEAF